MGIGQPIRRFEDARILAGRSEFLDDVRVDGALHLAFVRSPHAHARVRSVRGAADPPVGKRGGRATRLSRRGRP